MKLHHTTILASLALLSPTAVSQSTERVNQAQGAEPDNRSESPEGSIDGKVVVWQTLATNYSASDTNSAWDIILLDRESGVPELISTDGLGNAANSHSTEPVISDNGRYVAYRSTASNIIPGLNGGIFLYDRVLQSTQYASHNDFSSSASCGQPAISSTGRYVAFMSQSRLKAADTNSADDIYLYDRVTDSVELVSTNASGTQASLDAVSPSVDSSGRYVVFECSSSAWGAAFANYSHIWRKDMQTGALDCVSTTVTDVPANALCRDPDISADGKWVGFLTVASNLAPGTGFQVASKNLVSGEVHHVSVNDSGTAANNYCYEPELSADGRLVNFRTAANNVHMGGSVSYYSLYVRDVRLNTTRKVSLTNAGASNTGECDIGSVSITGRYVVFSSTSPSLVSGDTNGHEDIFVRDRFGDATHSYGWSPEESIGCTPHIEWSGSPSASVGSGFTIELQDVRGMVPGLMVYSASGPNALPLLGSNLYVGSPSSRTAVLFSGGTAGLCDGLISIDFNAHVTSSGNPALIAGAQVWAQYWSRDIGSLDGSHLSDAIAFVLGS